RTHRRHSPSCPISYETSSKNGNPDLALAKIVTNKRARIFDKTKTGRTEQLAVLFISYRAGATNSARHSFFAHKIMDVFDNEPLETRFIIAECVFYKFRFRKI